MDRIKWSGIVKVRRIPDGWTEEDFKYWWLPRSVDPITGIMRIPPRMSEEEKEGLTIATSHNTLLVNGMNTIVSYIISTGTVTAVMFQYFAVGSGPISAVAPGNTSLSGEFFRKQTTGVVNAGAQATVSTLFGTSDGNGTWTCGGLFGISATGTLGSGTLMSEVMYLPNFVKGSVAYVQDYTLGISSN